MNYINLISLQDYVVQHFSLMHSEDCHFFLSSSSSGSGPCWHGQLSVDYLQNPISLILRVSLTDQVIYERDNLSLGINFQLSFCNYFFLETFAGCREFTCPQCCSLAYLALSVSYSASILLST